MFISWLVLEVVFLVDMMITFRLAYLDGLQMVTSKRKIGLHYLRTYFIVDLLAVIPYEVCYTLFDVEGQVMVTADGSMTAAAIARTALPLLRIVRPPLPPPPRNPADAASPAVVMAPLPYLTAHVCL